MVQAIKLNKRNVIYYDVEKKTIARFPTKSNLIDASSDNSLYFGLVGNEEVEKVICSILDVTNINEMSGKKYNMKCGSEIVNVICNINSQSQIQIKVAKDGSMGKLASDYAYNRMKEYDFTKMLIVVDFANCELRIKDPLELDL